MTIFDELWPQLGMPQVPPRESGLYEIECEGLGTYHLRLLDNHLMVGISGIFDRWTDRIPSLALGMSTFSKQPSGRPAHVFLHEETWPGFFRLLPLEGLTAVDIMRSIDELTKMLETLASEV